MKTLDLHGVRHAEAKKLLIRFIEDLWGTGNQVEIVTGHSIKMREVVEKVLKEYKLEYNIGGYLQTDLAIITTDL